MKLVFSRLFSLIALLFVINTHAGTDPIAWAISPSGGFPAATTIGNSYAVSYTLTNNLPFPVTLSAYGTYVGGSFAIANGCNTTLSAKGNSGSSCLVHLSFQPTKNGSSKAFITMAYHKNRVPLPTLSSTASSGETPDRINGKVTTPLPAVTYIGNSYPLAFTFFNNGPKSVTATAVAVSGFTASTNTCTAALAANSTCIVSGNFTPSAVTQYTLGATYTYSNNGTSYSVPLTTQTNAQNGSGSCHHVSGFVHLPLPSSTLTYADHVIRVTFTNHCNSNTETLGEVSLSSDASNPPTITKGTDTCSNQTLAANGTCSVYASVIPNSSAPESTDLTITTAVPYFNNTLVADASTSTIVNAISNQSSLHTLMFVSQCTENVWYAIQNGAGGSGPSRKSPDPTPVSDRTWQGYQLDQQIAGMAPITKVLQFSEYVNGSMAGRTKCDTDPSSGNYGTCYTGNCTSLPYNGVSNSTGTCNESIAPSNPVTIYESTMEGVPNVDGSYDISLINGFNIPGEFRSLGAVSNPINYSSACGQSTGAIIQQSGSTLTNCSWSFTPPNTGTDCSANTGTDNPANFYNVTPGTDDSCTPATVCPGSQVCGMAWTPQPASNPGYLGTPVNRRCGNFLGYWTINDWVNYAAATGLWGSCNLYTHYGLATTLDSIKPATQPSYGKIAGVSANLADLFGCPSTTDNGSLNSGYQPRLTPPASTNVCGCVNWTQGPAAKQCLNINALWVSQILNHISWLKTACPNVYTYPYDDESSSFTCNVAGEKTAYQITFCPGSKSGAPGS